MKKKSKASTMFVYYDSIQSNYDLIRRTLSELSTDITRAFEERGFPAHPVLNEDDSTASLVRWAIDYLDMHKSSLTQQEWRVCIDVYESIPKRHSGEIKGDTQHAGEVEVYLKSNSLEASQCIADYLMANDISVPRLTRAGKVNHKVVAGLAVIYMGCVLERGG